MVSSAFIIPEDKKEGDCFYSFSIVRDGLTEEISRKVLRKKLAKQRHLVIKEAIHPEYLDSLFPSLLDLFDPQTVHVRF